MVERSLSMREVRGSMPLSSNFSSPQGFTLLHSHSFNPVQDNKHTLNHFPLDRLYSLILRAALMRMILRITLPPRTDSVISFSVAPSKCRVSHSSGDTFGSCKSPQPTSHYQHVPKPIGVLIVRKHFRVFSVCASSKRNTRTCKDVDGNQTVALLRLLCGLRRLLLSLLLVTTSKSSRRHIHSRCDHLLGGQMGSGKRQLRQRTAHCADTPRNAIHLLSLRR